MKADQMQQLSSMFLLIVSTCFLQGCSAEEPQESQDIISSLTLEWRKTNLYASWTLLNPSGHLGYYSVTWNEGVQTRTTTQTMQELTMGSTFSCFHALNVTVAPHNKTGFKIGEPASRSHIWQDILTNIRLKKDGNVIRAYWSVKCRSKTYLSFEVTCHEDGTSLSTPQTSSDSATRGQTKFSGLCSKDTVFGCTGFFVTIQRTNGVPPNNSISASGLYLSFELHFEQLSPVSIKLTWPSPSRICAITKYIVHYSGTQLWGEIWTSTEWYPIEEHVYTGNNMKQWDAQISDRKEIFLINLWPYSDYVVSVTAERSANESLKSSVIFQTPESKPSAPPSITTTTNASNIVVNWSKPMRMNGKLAKYILRWYMNSTLVGTHNTTKQSFKIGNLEPCVNYNITISAVTGGGEGEAAQKSRTVGNDCNRRRFNTTITTSTSNSDSSNEPHTTESSSPVPINEPTSCPDWTWCTGLVVGCLLVIIFLVIILVRWRRRDPCRRWKFKTVISEQIRPPPIDREITSVREQNNTEMRPTNGTQPSDADALFRNPNGEYNDRPRVMDTTSGQVAADETTPLGTSSSIQNINEVNTDASCNIRNAET